MEELFPTINYTAPRQITMHFKAYWKQALLSGKKTSTTRTFKSSKQGDTFEAYGGTFEIVNICKVKLGTVHTDFWKDEGCDSPEHFEQVWCSIHPLARLKPELLVWIYFFRRIS